MTQPKKVDQKLKTANYFLKKVLERLDKYSKKVDNSIK